MPYRKGRKSAAQTPAPPSERIYGSKKNPKETAKSSSSASKIVLSEKTIEALKNKAKEYNKKHKDSVSVSTLKAVYRRGAGAYSSSHRPTITGGAPNSRNAWAMARVNKFLLKKSGAKVKAAYVQDDDLMAEGGMFEKGGLIAPNGRPSNLNPEQYQLVRTPEFKKWFGDWENDPENASKVVDENGEPMVVYRGNLYSQDELGYTFELGKNFLQKESSNQFGFFFTNKIDIAKKYMLVDHFDEIKGGSITSVFLSANDVLDLRKFGLKIEQEKFIQGLKDLGISFSGYEDLINKIINFNPDEYTGWGYYVFDYFDLFPELRNLFIDNKINAILFSENSRSSFFYYDVYVVFNSNQIKLADGKNTTFDGSNPDIRFEEGGVAYETETFYNEDDVPYYKRKGALNVSYLNDEEWKLVTSPEFKQWFGDWQSEKPYSSKSKDVSQVRQWMYYGSYLGEPKIVYHASTDWAGKPYKEFYVFQHGDYARDAGYFGKGFYFGVSESSVKQYGKYIRKFFLNIRNPYKHGFSASDEGNPIEFAEELGLDHLLYAPDKYKEERPYPTKEFAQAVQDKLISLGYDGIHIDGKDGEQYVAFYPEQIKLADGTNTTFDGSNPDMRFEKGGFNDEVIVCSNCLWSWKASESTPEEKYICHKCGHDNSKDMDTITLDVPLFIRLLEYAREDAKDDMALHTLTENALKLGNKTLTMDDYEQIIASKITEGKEDVLEIPTIEEEFKDGGVVVGKRHSEEDEFGTGEKFLVESTGQVVELEGGEGVMCKESMQSQKQYTFDGKKMTGRQIASFLNHKYGGVSFADGGEVDSKSVCGCRSKYYHGGELPSATLDSLKGGEAVVTVKTMESKDKYQFQGKEMTPRKILSHINADSGGKKFEDGGIIDLTEHHFKNINKLTKMVYFTEKILYF